MNIALWILQVFLAVVFAAHGWIYATWSASKREAQHAKLGGQPGGEPLDLPPAFNTFIGISELLGAVGLILPGVTGILTRLTPLAAAGLAIVMTGASVTHLSRREYRSGVFTVIVIAICMIVAYGRWLTIPM